MFRHPSLPLRISLSAIVSLVVIGQAADAAILARYEFSGSLASTDDDVANLTSTASDISDGPGFTSGYYSGGGNPSPSRSITVDQTPATEGSANSDGDYFLITITPAAGYQINLTSFTVDFGASYNSVGRGVGLRTSVNNFGNAVGTFSESAGTGTAGAFTNHSINLSGASLQGITTPVTFRITVYDGASSVGNANRFDNIIINGTVTAIPEPAATGLAAIAGCLALATRRRGSR